MPHHVRVNQSCPKLDLSGPYPSASITLQELSPDKNCNVASNSLKMDERWCFVNYVFLLKQIPDSGISPLRAALHISKKCSVSQVTVPMMLLPQQNYPVILSNYLILPLQSYIFLIGSRMSLKIIFVQTGIQTRSSNHLWAALSLSVWSDHFPAFIRCH